jgi:hypothetical protein
VSSESFTSSPARRAEQLDQPQQHGDHHEDLERAQRQTVGHVEQRLLARQVLREREPCRGLTVAHQPEEDDREHAGDRSQRRRPDCAEEHEQGDARPLRAEVGEHEGHHAEEEDDDGTEAGGDGSLTTNPKHAGTGRQLASPARHEMTRRL